MKYRLGLKIGDSYIGWSMMGINEKKVPINIIDQGIRVFSNGREPSRKKGLLGESKATTRLLARSMRRQTERTRMRRINTRKQLIKFGLLPFIDKEQSILNSINPLKLRNDAITTRLEPHEIGRALFHLQQKRGFKSNRKDASKNAANELSGMKLGISNLTQILDSKYTLGQYLYKRYEKELSTKFRPNLTEKDLPMYELYASRDMVEKEFNSIWESQKLYYPELLTDQAYKAIHMAIFKQRSLKAPVKGKCRILENEDRMEWAIPSAQHFRIIKEINNLRFTFPDSMAGNALNTSERKKLYKELLLKNHLTFKQINKLLGLSSQYEFNLDCNGREKIDGDKIAKLMRDLERFGLQWDALPLQEQNSIMYVLFNNNVNDANYMDDETLEHWLVNNYKLSISQAQKIMNTAFPESVAAYGKTIITSILPLMIDEGCQEVTAMQKLGYKINFDDSIHNYNYLPYYGEILDKYVSKTGKSNDNLVEKYGKISNPTVHIILNELRKLMNRLKEKHREWPSGITIEIEPILRKGNKALLEDLKYKEKRNKKYNSWRNEIEKYKGGSVTKEDFLKMELWEELAEDPMHRKCILSGRTINIAMLFSDEVQVGYILPYSKTLDGSKSNLLLMESSMAYMKGGCTPFEAFCDMGEYNSHSHILARSMSLPKHKQWRFRADAMEIFISKTLDGEKDEKIGLDIFAIKPLSDNNYTAKLFKKYLQVGCALKESNIHTTSGNFTYLLRGAWGMNDLLEMGHNDYRRFTLDATILALTTSFIVKKISEAALLEEIKGIKITKTIGNLKPFALFDWEKMQHDINKIIVSHRPTVNPMKKLHDDTIYFHKATIEKDMEVIIRKPLSNIKNKAEINHIYYKHGRELLKEIITNDQDIGTQLKEFSSKKNINNISNPFYKARAVRMLYTKPSNIMISVKHSSNKVAQGGSNHRAEVFSAKEGINAEKWQMEIIKTFDANNPEFIPNWRKEYPDAQLIMVLHGNDMVVYEEESILRITKVKKISGNKIIALVPHNLTKDKEEENMWSASARQLQLKNARKISVKVDGTLYDSFSASIRKKEIA